MMRRLIAMDSYVGTTQATGQRLRPLSSQPCLALFQSCRKAIFVTIEYAKRIFESLCSRTFQTTNFRFNFWGRSDRNEAESGVIRPPEFYDGTMFENDNDYNHEKELQPLDSEMV